MAEQAAQSDAQPIRVTLIDDQAIVLAGVAALIGREPGLVVMATAASLAEGIELVSQQPPDVVVCDIQIGADSGFAILEAFPDRRPPIILLSSFEHPAYYSAAFEHGAAGYVLKGSVVDQLVDAIRIVAAGGSAFPVGTTPDPGQKARRPPPSGRELELIQQVVEGRSNDEVAARLGISAKTVDSHLRSLFDRYGVRSRTHLALHAVSEGWVRAAGASGSRGGDRSGGRWVAEGAVARQPRRNP